MKFQKFISEAYLMSQYKFGFEFEGIAEKSKWDNRDKLKEYFDKEFGKGGDVKGDSSIKDFDTSNYFSFEYVSDIFTLVPINVQKIVNFLDIATKNGLTTNETCGFHIHISFPNITLFDQYWVLINLAFDQKILKTLKTLTDLKFFDKTYANGALLGKIKKCIVNGEYSNMVDYFTDEKSKYSLLNPHQQGTLEWRGPRGFLEKRNKDIIMSLFLKLYEFVKWIDKTIEKTEVNGITKKEIFDGIEIVKKNRNFEEKEMKKEGRIFGHFQDKKVLFTAFKLYPELSKAKFNRIHISFVENNDNKLSMTNGEVEGLELRRKNVILRNCTIINSEIDNANFSFCKTIKCKIKNGYFSDSAHPECAESEFDNCDFKNFKYYETSNFNRCVIYGSPATKKMYECYKCNFNVCEIVHGRYRSCNFERCNVKEAEIDGNSVWKNGVFYGGNFLDSRWEDGIWEDGFMIDSVWVNGTWNGGKFNKGIWEDGKFNGGTWNGGTWENGFFGHEANWEKGIWKKGKIHVLRYNEDAVVETTDINPKELNNEIDRLEKTNKYSNLRDMLKYLESSRLLKVIK